MSFEWISIEYAGEKLDGLYCLASPTAPLCVFLHGTGGNFYGNRFIRYLAETYLRMGWSVLTMNLPGYEWRARDETFEDSRAAIDAWLERIDNDRVILQGHSLGALKALDYLRFGRHSRRVRALALLSPFDIVAFHAGAELNRLGDLRSSLELQATTSGGDQLVSKAIFPHWDVSLTTFLRLIQEGGPADVFPSRKAGVLKSADWLPSIPTLIALGGNDFAAYPSPIAVSQSLPQSKLVSSVLIDGAPHNFDGHLDQLRSAVAAWVADLALP